MMANFTKSSIESKMQIVQNARLIELFKKKEISTKYIYFNYQQYLPQAPHVKTDTSQKTRAGEYLDLHLPTNIH